MAVTNLLRGSPKKTSTIAVDDDLLELSRRVNEDIPTIPKDKADFIFNEQQRLHSSATINRDGTLRDTNPTGPVGIKALQRFVLDKDQDGLVEGLQRTKDFQFDISGAQDAVGGTPLLEEALTKPGWQHSGRQVNIVQMSPIEYLQKSAEGHGVSFEELLSQISTGDRTDSILDAIVDGKAVTAPYLDYRNGAFGQEGQHRAMAAAMLGKEKIPVAVMWDDAPTRIRTVDDLDDLQTQRTLIDGDYAKLDELVDEAERVQFGRARFKRDNWEVISPEERKVMKQDFMKRKKAYNEALKESPQRMDAQLIRRDELRTDPGAIRSDLTPSAIHRSGIARDFPVDGKFMHNGKVYSVLRHRKGPQDIVQVLARPEGSSGALLINLNVLVRDAVPLRRKSFAPTKARGELSGFDMEQQWYHSTVRGEDIAKDNEFLPFSHFGTRKSAEDRAENVSKGSWEELKEDLSKERDSLITDVEMEELGYSKNDFAETPSMFAVNVKMDNPLTVLDNGLYDWNDFVRAARQVEAITEHEADTLMFGGGNKEQFLQLLESKGYDGFRYINQVEDRGSVSISPFRNTQIRSIHARHKDPTSTKLTAGVGGAAAGATAASVSLGTVPKAEAGTLDTLYPEASQIATDEGSREESYLDSKGLLTGGVGHLMTAEEAKKYPKGTKIPQDVRDKWFEEDLKSHKKDADKFIKGIGTPVPPEVEQIIQNMMFNMGATRFSAKKWPKFTAALKAQDWEAAADEMEDSDWFNDVGRRSKRLVKRMRGVRSR